MRLFTHLRQKQRDAAELAVARQDGFFRRFLDRLAELPQPSLAERTVTILARSPASPVTRAMVDRADDLKASGVAVRVLFGRIDPEDELREAARSVARLLPDCPLDKLVRWADNTCLHDAHEQLTLGTGMCWSGDMLRRDPGKRDGLDLFEADAPGTVRLGALAFNAIWSISSSVPASRLRARPARPSGAYVQELGEDMPRPAFLRPEETPPLLRH